MKKTENYNIEEILEYVYKQMDEKKDRAFEKRMDKDGDLSAIVNSAIHFAYRNKCRSAAEYMEKIKKTYPARDKLIENIQKIKK